MSHRDPSAYFNFTLPSASEVPPAAVLHPRQARGAVASLVLGIVSLPLVLFTIGFPLAIVGVVCGINGLLAVKKGAGRIKGRVLAIIGLVCCVTALVGGALWISYLEKHPVQETPPAIQARPTMKPLPKAAPKPPSERTLGPS